MKTIAIALVTTFGLYAGTASALSVTVDLSSTLPQTPATGDFSPVWGMNTDVIGDGIDPNPGGVETDNSSNVSVTAPANGSIDVDGWYGLDAVTTGIFSIISSVATRDDNAAIVKTLNLEIYEITGATDLTSAGGTATYDLSLVDSAAADALSLGLTSGTDYLVRAFGNLTGGVAEDLGYSFDVEVRSVVPVPAAVWLFGTAMLGLIGLRRKSRAAVPA